MTHEEIRKALEESTKTSRKALAKMALEIETGAPERYREILAKKDWEGEAYIAYTAYRKALVFSRIVMILACIVVVGSYLAGDFGMRLITERLGRYTLAVGLVLGMGLFSGGILLLNVKKERLVAYGVLAGM